MNISTLLQHRLTQQQIEHTAFKTPHEVVAWFGVMQGQDYAGVKWSIGLRMQHGTDAAVEQALIERRIVRTWAVRGTLHMLVAEDLRWLVALLGQRLIASGARRYRELELDAPTLARSADLIAEHLSDGKSHSRTAILTMLHQHHISTAGQRAPHILQHAALRGLICQTNTVRNTPNYVAVDDALPHGKPMSPEEAVAELARRYFTSHGPATLNDFAWWSGLKVSDARAGIAANRAHLDEARIHDEAHWFAPLQQAVTPQPRVHLLPGFDEYLLGYQRREDVIPRQHHAHWTHGNGMFTPLFVIDGRIAGRWKRTTTRNKITLDATSIHKLSSQDVTALHEAADQYGQFLGLPVTVGLQEAGE